LAQVKSEGIAFDTSATTPAGLAWVAFYPAMIVRDQAGKEIKRVTWPFTLADIEKASKGN
jgi:hypothetical protein